MAGRTLVSVERLRQVLSYDPETGVVSWKKNGRPAGGRKTGPNGYLRVRVDGVLIRQHRAAWMIQTGEVPIGDIDHINGDGSDNRWSNLRLCSRSENKQNQGVSKRSTSGVTGVSYYSRHGRWQAQIQINYRQKHLGYFATKEEASEAYRKAKAALHTFHPTQVTRLAPR